jgi:hypothetical protein
MATRKPKVSEAQAAQDRHDQRKSWFIHEASRQALNRALMAKCEGFYDNEQWTQEDRQELEDRGQRPIVYNEIAPTIDWLIGTERRSRVDFVVTAEEPGDEADQDARNKTKLLKYLDDSNRAEFERSYAAEQCFKAGLGWLEVGVRGDKVGPKVFVGAESWRNILWDSMASRRDLTDARYLFRIKVVDLDVALALFPDKEDEVRAVRQIGDRLQVFSEWLGVNNIISGTDVFGQMLGNSQTRTDYNTSTPVDLFNPRERVLLLECWSRDPYREKLPDGTGLGDPITHRIRCSIMTERDTLLEDWSPFKHDRFPFIPVWAYRNSRTGLPYPPTFRLMGPQEGLNHRMSKSLFEASKNQLMAEKSAFDSEVMDPEQIQMEMNDPNGIAIFNDGALSGGRVRQVESSNKAAQQMQLAEREVATIRQSSGVTSDNRGLQSNVISGKAVMAKQDQGSLLTAELFDNLLMSRQIEGELTLSLAEQYMVQPMTIRNPGETGDGKFSQLNQPQADGTYANDITARRSQFIVGEQAWKQSYAEASFDSLMEMMAQLASSAPQVVINLLDVVFEMHPSLPQKRLVIDRIRAINGQSNPDEKPTPQQEQAAKQQQELAQKRFEAEMANLDATVRKAKAEGKKLDAEAVGRNITSIYEAAQAAQVAVQMPGAMPVADQLLASAGFVDESGEGTGAVVPQGMPALPQAEPSGQIPDASRQLPEGAPTVDPLPELQQADGAQSGIETVRPDGVINPGDQP